MPIFLNLIVYRFKQILVGKLLIWHVHVKQNFGSFVFLREGGQN